MKTTEGEASETENCFIVEGWNEDAGAGNRARLSNETTTSFNYLDRTNDVFQSKMMTTARSCRQ